MSKCSKKMFVPELLEDLLILLEFKELNKPYLFKTSLDLMY